MMRVFSAFVFGVLSLWALGQPEFFQDLAYGGKPFNPGDVGLVMKAVLRDNDAGNTDPIYLTRLSLENLGNAGPGEIEWVEVRMENSCGKTVVLAWSSGFPLMEVLLGRPAEERMIPDDGEATLTVWVKVTKNIVEGHTVQPKLVLGWAEGEKGGEIVLTDGAPEKFLVAGSFSAKILPGPAGGNLNPGDQFPVAEIEVWDTADVNPWGLDLLRIRIDGPKELVWILDNKAQKVEIPAGRDYVLPEKLFAALDEGKNVLTVHVRVPESFYPKEPVAVAPTITLVLAEAFHEQTFKVSDPVADRVLAAGFEELSIEVAQAGKILDPSTRSLSYSLLKLADRDRNATPLILHSLRLRALGTVAEIATVEVVDGGGRFVGFGKGIKDAIPLLSPDGKPLLVLDEGDVALRVNLTFSGKLPLGGSLLLAHDLDVEEKLPRDWLFRSDALTNFRGTQSLVPSAAVFFGKPTVKLAKVEDRAILSTDGETIGLISGKLSVQPWEFVDLSAQGLSGYKLTPKPLEDGLSLSLEAGKTVAKAGDLAAFVPSLKPVRVPKKEMAVTLSLTVDKVVDWAGISLPFSLGPSQAAFSFTVPQIGILPTPERKDAAVIHADTALSALKAYVYFNPELPVELSQVQGFEPYAAEVVAEEKPEPGRILLSLTLLPGKEPQSGALAQLVFAKKVKEEVVVPVRIEVLEARDAAGKPVPFFLDPEALELKF
jgi:hypothetical protein